MPEVRPQFAWHGEPVAPRDRRRMLAQLHALDTLPESLWTSGQDKRWTPEHWLIAALIAGAWAGAFIALATLLSS